MRRFTGCYTHSVDAKNRVAVPRKILDTLKKLDSAEGVMLTVGLDDCLFLYTEDGFDAIGDEVDEKPLGEEAVRDFSRQFHTQAEFCSIDRSSRLLLPAHLKEFAGVTGKIVFCGVGKRVELWSPERWESRTEQAVRQYKSHAKDVLR